MNFLAAHTLRNDLADLRQVEPWILEFARAAGLSPAAKNAFDLALTEWLTNVINHGFTDSREHRILVQFRTGPVPGEARIEIEDEGREFNPLQHPEVDTSLPLEQRPIGGLGIHMMRKLMDQVDYHRANGRNRLTLTRRIT